MSSSFDYKNTLLGACSGVTSAVIFQPFDVVKTLVQKNKAQNTYKGFNYLIKHTYLNNGIRGFYAGTHISVFRVLPGAGVYFYALPFLDSISQTSSKTTHLLNGLLARGCASIITLPFAVVKTNIEASNEKLSTTCSSIYHKYGLKGFYRGLLPTILRDAPNSGIYYMLYRAFNSNNFNNPYLTFFNSVQAATIALLLTHPFDVLKTKQQLLTNVSKSNIRVFIFKHAFDGFFLRAIRKCFGTATTWTIYESLKFT